MNFQFPVSNFECRPACGVAARRRNSTGNAFTLIELLVVISIIGLLAAVGMPALKGFGKSNAIAAADRQLLDDLQFARQRAIAEHTGVFVVFVSPVLTSALSTIGNYSPAQQQQITNILNQQYSAYTMLSRRSVGDQPGRPNTNYLTGWRNLPDGIILAPQKFNYLPSQFFYINQFDASVPIYGFNTNSFPFPSATNSNWVLPYVAFNYLGQLSTDGINLADHDEYILLARGSIFYDANFNADVLLVPPGNDTNLYNIIHIDALTGRPRVEQQQIK